MEARSAAVLSQSVFFRIVLYGYSPVPKYCILIPERTSNSVFAVPAPTTGTVR